MNFATMFTTHVVIEKVLGILSKYAVQEFGTEFKIHRSRSLKMIIGYFPISDFTFQVK